MLYWGKVNQVVEASVFDITLSLGFDMFTTQKVYVDTPWVADADAQQAVRCLVMMTGGKRILAEVVLKGTLRLFENAPCFPAELLLPVPPGVDMKAFRAAEAVVPMNGIPGGTYPEHCLVVSRLLKACRDRGYDTELVRPCYRWRTLANGQARA